MIKYVYWSSCNVSVILVSLMKLTFSENILVKYSDIKFHENPSSGSRVVSCGRTDGRADITKLTVVFPILRTRLKMLVGYCINNTCTFYVCIINDKCPVISIANIGAVNLV